MRSSNLVPLLAPTPAAGLGFRQGKVIAFNADTGANTIDVGGTALVDVPMLNSGDVITYEAGDVVALLTFKSSWWILGRVTLPGAPKFASGTISMPHKTETLAANVNVGPGAELILPQVFDVPGWATRCMVIAYALVSYTNTSGSSISVFTNITVDGVFGLSLSNGILAGFSDIAEPTAQRFDGSLGSTLTVAVRCNPTATLRVDAGTYIEATAFFAAEG